MIISLTEYVLFKGEGFTFKVFDSNSFMLLLPSLDRCLTAFGML